MFFDKFLGSHQDRCRDMTICHAECPGMCPMQPLKCAESCYMDFNKHWKPLKVPVWVRYQIIQIHQFVELFAGWNEKNPTGVHLDWHGLYTNPSAKVPTRECCCINIFSDEVGLCDSENDVVVVIVCFFFGKTNRRFGGSGFVFFHDNILSTDV